MVWIHKGETLKKWMVRLKGRHKKIYLKNINSLIGDKIFEKWKIYIYEIQKKFFFSMLYIYVTGELENFQDKKIKILYIISI